MSMKIRDWIHPPGDEVAEEKNVPDSAVTARQTNNGQDADARWAEAITNPDLSPPATVAVPPEARATLEATPIPQDDSLYSRFDNPSLRSGESGDTRAPPTSSSRRSSPFREQYPQSQARSHSHSPSYSQSDSQQRSAATYHHDSASSASASGSGSGLGSNGLHPGSHRETDNASLHAPSHFSTGLSIDTDSSDTDSALGSIRAQSSSMSASSSIFDFVEEHGRTWHRYHEGKYFMPNDIPEQERLDLQHSISVRLFGGLYLAPIERPNRVLDIGTGTGIWAIEFANEHPESDVLGTDLSPIQPEYVPPNCRFEVDDAEDEWVFGARFDLIHARFMCGSFKNFPAIFASCYENLSPGGWIEFQDYYVKLQAMDDSLAGTALERWNDVVLDGVSRMGLNGLAAARFKAQMLDAGFVDVVEQKFALPGNPWAKGDDQKMLGMMQMENILDGVHGISIGLFTKMLGMTAEEVELFLVDVRKDMKNTKIHFYYIVYSVYGRKP